MAADKPGQDDLVNRILYGSAGVKTAEEAVQSALKTFIDGTALEVAALVKSNTLFPEMREEMLKMEKSVAEMTIEAINSIGKLPSKYTKSDS